MKKTIMENVGYFVNEAKLAFIVCGPENWAKTGIAFVAMCASVVIASYSFLLGMVIVFPGFGATCFVNGLDYAIAEVNAFVVTIWVSSITAGLTHYYVENMLNMMELKCYNYDKENY